MSTPNSTNSTQPQLLSALGTLITYRELTGRSVQSEELHAILRTLDLNDVVLRIAWCSGATAVWETAGILARDTSVRNYLFPFLRDALDKYSKDRPNALIFSRYTLLWLLKQALAHCAIDGTRLEGEVALTNFARACLMANDLAYCDVTGDGPVELKLASKCIPFIENCSSGEYQLDIARNLMLLGSYSDPQAESARNRLLEFIESKIEMKVTEYCDLALLSSMQGVVADVTLIENYRLPCLSASHFDTTTVPEVLRDKYLGAVSVSLLDLMNEVRSEPQAAEVDFTAIWRHPFLQTEQGLAPLDLTAALDKAGRGLFWTALKSSEQSKEREARLQDWGTIFEAYVKKLLHEGLRSRSRAIVIRSPVFVSGEEAGDMIVIEDDLIIVIECKANTIGNSVKYSFDTSKLERILETRFVTGSDTGRKGLSQIWSTIEGLAKGKQVLDRVDGSRYDLSSYRRVLPLLVHLDRTLQMPGIPHYLTRRFKAMHRVRRLAVLPFAPIAISELEELEGYLDRMSLAEIIVPFLEKLRSDITSAFYVERLPHLTGYARVPGQARRGLDDYIYQMGQRSFRKELPDQRPALDGL
jgi:hypothetical protein